MPFFFFGVDMILLVPRATLVQVLELRLQGDGADGTDVPLHGTVLPHPEPIVFLSGHS
jgi:hypothetical protein